MVERLPIIWRDQRIVPSTGKNERRKRGRKKAPDILKKKNKYGDRNKDGVMALKIEGGGTKNVGREWETQKCVRD